MKKKEKNEIPDVIVKQDQENPEPIELIAKSIIDIAEGFEKLKTSKLKRRAIVLLLQDAIGSSNITKSQIEKVLEYTPKLKDIYLNK